MRGIGSVQEAFASPVPFKHRPDLQRHFIRHGIEFGADTADEYERLADEFMIGPLRNGAMECFRKNGAKVRFDPGTNEFGILAKEGYVSTFMVVRTLPSSNQTAFQYFQSNCN